MNESVLFSPSYAFCKADECDSVVIQIRSAFPPDVLARVVGVRKRFPFMRSIMAKSLYFR